MRNDWWAKGLGFTQPKSEAWMKYKSLDVARKARAKESAVEAALCLATENVSTGSLFNDAA